jgi:hypothetical protein
MFHDELNQIDSQAQLLLSEYISSWGSAAGILGDGTETNAMDVHVRRNDETQLFCHW